MNEAGGSRQQGLGLNPRSGPGLWASGRPVLRTGDKSHQDWAHPQVLRGTQSTRDQEKARRGADVSGPVHPALPDSGGTGGMRARAPLLVTVARGQEGED